MGSAVQPSLEAPLFPQITLSKGKGGESLPVLLNCSGIGQERDKDCIICILKQQSTFISITERERESQDRNSSMSPTHLQASKPSLNEGHRCKINCKQH